ncbi:unnamed protein product [Eruca vesicaria subsp. sativa]|uniref:Dilute domain-containing protein n=1 Tax=Eruca vesicaria subsp. sativa TaxID=29727 RepID=A0ABC8K400_ERUVS|nr:unnamed protein product [Eruca vesicaria subsp. sativa]
MSTPAALQAMQLKVLEENVSVIREEDASVDKATTVFGENAEKLISLTSEVEALKLGVTQELLVKCIRQNLGFAGGKPVAAYLIYKCLLHWRSFELEETNIFDSIIQTIALAIEVPDNNPVLVYWLSNSCMLLKLLQHTFTSATIPASRGCMGGSVVSSLDKQMHVDAKYPATLFKQQLIGFLEKIVLLSHVCCSFGEVEYVEAGLAELKQWCVEATDEYVGSAWDELKHIRQAAGFLQAIIQKQEMTLDKITRELCPVMIIRLLHCFFLTNIEVAFVVQVLSIRQLYRISSMYFDDIYDMNSVSSDVISSMMITLIDDLMNDGVRNDFLLEDDLSNGGLSIKAAFHLRWRRY